MQNVSKLMLVIVFLIVLGSLVVTWKLTWKRSFQVTRLTIAGQILKVEVVKTPQAQAQGLSTRQDLVENEGMLFVFDHPARYSFWMKDMNFPIDIIWLNQNFQVVYIKKNAEPSSYPEIFTSDQNAQYVLEVIAGFSDRNNLELLNIASIENLK